ncbi:hypothetical protein HGRIS_010491 [Hohenbuehelia grisea]|uniref:Uncharacterized protein n=1 Tax=Hohenbuehelia grisea TaxID=104357 RepID=A0ABR3IZR9_9AGAR
MMGLDLEEAQRCQLLIRLRSDRRATDRQHSLIAQRSKVLGRICAWTKYKLCTALRPPSSAFEEAATPVVLPLCPLRPQAIPPSELRPCGVLTPSLAKSRWQLRVAQASDTLADISANLHIQSAMYATRTTMSKASANFAQ